MNSLRYAITQLTGAVPAASSDAAHARRTHWLRDLDRWAGEGIDFVQLREKSLDAGELFRLVRLGMDLLERRKSATGSPGPRLLVNGRADLAVAAGAHGVHLPGHAGDLTASEVQRLYRRAGLPACTVSRSCHNPVECRLAREAGTDLILFGPVFEKRVGGRVVVEGLGLGQLAEAVQAAKPVPVLALGGVTADREADCRRAGAAGIAGIRLFA